MNEGQTTAAKGSRADASREGAEPKKAIRLAPQVGRRAERGHLWIFANEVASISGEAEPGDEFAVFSAKRNFLGMALLSRSSLIRARIYSREPGRACDAGFIAERIAAAAEYRRALAPGAHSYRLIHGEADGLPGAVADVYGNQIVIQISTQAMEARRAVLAEALRERFNPRAIIERSDVGARKLEGLEPRKEILFGEPLLPAPVEENGVRLFADLMEGQKTGYFLDQAANRAFAAERFAGARVLDVFCYVGSWSILAAARGAGSVLGVDSSAPALELARRAVSENGLDPEKIEFREEDAFKILRRFAEEKRVFEAVIVDPPAFAKSKRDVPAALRAYRELNLRAMRLVPPGGWLASCSCSHNVSREDFAGVLVQAAKDARADFAILREGAQSPDHPIHLATPETGYLKTFFLRRMA